MKKLILIALLFSPALIHAQSLKKYSIGQSGCSVYAFCDMKFGMDYSQDSSKVYTGECLNNGFNYGVICVKLKDSIPDLSAAEDIMMQYIEYLKANFNITQQAGAGHGLTLKDRTDIKGVQDYWEDQEKNNWKYKAWTNGKYIGFLYVYSKKEVPISANVFLEGFRFPGM